MFRSASIRVKVNGEGEVVRRKYARRTVVDKHPSRKDDAQDAKNNEVVHTVAWDEDTVVRTRAGHSVVDIVCCLRLDDALHYPRHSASLASPVP
jgi:hypothetical protein